MMTLMSHLEVTGPLLVQPLAMSQQEVQVHRQPCKVVLIQLGRVVGTQLISGGLRWSANSYSSKSGTHLSRDSSDFVSVDQGPGGSVGGVFRVSIQCPDEWDNESVMCPRMHQLMPPILTNYYQYENKWSTSDTY